MVSNLHNAHRLLTYIPARNVTPGSTRMMGESRIHEAEMRVSI